MSWAERQAYGLGGPYLTLSSACPNCSLVYWKVREAKGVICAPKSLHSETSVGSIAQACRIASRPGCVMVHHAREVFAKVLEIHVGR